MIDRSSDRNATVSAGLDPRLQPPQQATRFYHHRLLREALETVAARYLAARQDCVLIDFGCGAMPYRPIFERYVTQYVGIDLPEKPHADFSSTGQLPDGAADIVLSTQVLEHAEQPHAYLGECYRLLKPGGLLVLSTHGYWMYHPDPHDFWRWTGEGLRKTIKDAGFHVVDFRGLMGLASTAVHLLQDALMPRLAGFARPGFAWGMQRLAALADRVHSGEERAADACVFLAVAVKPAADSGASGAPRAAEGPGDAGPARAIRSASPGRARGSSPVPGPGRPVVSIISPNKFAYSETFIRAHIERLPATVTVLSGGLFPTSTENGSPLLSGRAGARIARACARQLLRLPPEYFPTRALARYLAASGVEVVLAEYGPTGVAMLDACARAAIPLVVHFHGFDAYHRPTLETHGRSYPRLFGAAAAVVAVSRDMERALLSLGARRETLFCNPYGVDTDLFAGGDPAAAGPVFVAVGRFVEKKAPHLAVLAFAEVRRACPEARMIMIGDGPLLGATQQVARALGVAAAIEFPGPRPHPEVGAIMRRARAFVQHSVVASDGDTEGTPLAVLEAGATGLPVVATRHGGIPDAVVSGETGFLVEEGDVKGMAAGMIRLVADPLLAARLGSAARERVCAEFSLDRSMAALHRILEDVRRKATAAAHA